MSNGHDERRPPRHTPSGGTRPAGDRAGASLTASTDDGLYRLLVHSVRDYAIFALDRTGHVISWNRGAEAIKGYTADEIIGRHFSTFYPESDLRAGKPAMELDVASREGRFEEEGWRLRKDGSRFWASVVITALRDASGAVVGFAKVTRDLTDRRRAEQALRASEERFRLLVHSVADYGIFMLDPDGYVASWNAGAERMKGYTAHEIIGKHFSTFYPESDLRAGKPAMELEVATRVGKFEEEGWRLRKDGTRFWANVVITALRTPDGRLFGFAKVTRDLTERRAAQERELANARRISASEAANHAKTAFLAAMSHELRTPLNAIGGYTELIEVGVAGPVTEQQRAYLGRIRASQQHLLGIISDLLNYGRIEAGQVTYDLAALPLRSVVEAVVPLLEPQAGAKGVALERAPCADDVVARGDRTKVEQILLNLLSNAVKFTGSGGRVHVSCTVEAEHVSIAVADTGIGIAADQLGAIFEPFVQLGRSLTSTQEGTGLGLAISRELAQAMRGDITVESEPGVGSTFRLALPRG